MGDENKEGATAVAEKADSRKAPTKLTISDERLRKLASLMDPEEVERLVAAADAEEFDADVAEQVSRARQEIERKRQRQSRAALDVAEGPQALTDEQQGEWLRCRLGALAGMPVAPDPDLDDDGRISQLLGQRPQRLDVDGRITQAMGPTTGSAGGYAVPEEMINRIGVKAERGAVLWPLVAKFPTSRQSVTLPVENSVGDVSEGSAAKSSSTTSSDEIAETALTLAEKTWTMRYADARVRIKLDLLDDSPLNILDYVTRVVGRKFRYRRDQRIAQGRGSSRSEPVGLVESSGTTAGITTVAISAAINLSNLLSLVAELPEEYAMSATAVMHRTTKYDVINTLATNVRAAQFVVDELPAMAASPWIPKGQVLVGDFEYYLVAQNTLMYMLTDVVAKHFAMDIVFVEKWDGQVEQTAAFRLGTGVTY